MLTGAPIGRHALDRLAEDLDVAGGRLLEAGDQAQAGGLARAGGAEHGEELARRDVEIDAVDRAHGAEVARDARKETAGVSGHDAPGSQASMPLGNGAAQGVGRALP